MTPDSHKNSDRLPGTDAKRAKQVEFEILAPYSTRLNRLFAAYELGLQKIYTIDTRLDTLRETRRYLLSCANEFAPLIPKAVLAEHIEQIARRMLQWAGQVPRNICVDFVLLSASRLQTLAKVNIAGIGQLSIKLEDDKAWTLLHVGRICQVVKIGGHYALIVCDRQHDSAWSGAATGNTHAAKSKKRPASKLFASERMQKDQLRKRMIACPLCGLLVSVGSMLAHKRELHGEAIMGTSTKGSTRFRPRWVQVVQGGAPNLGKHKS